MIYTRTDRSGNFSFGNLEPGKYVIWLIYAKDKKGENVSFEVINSDVTLEPIEIED